MNQAKKRTVLIFAHECAPYNRPESTIGAQRPAQFAKWLPEFGWRAIVICCDAAHRRVAHRSDLAAIRREVKSRLADANPDNSIVIPTPSLVSDGILDALAQSFYTGRARRLPGARCLRKPLTALKLFTGDYSQSWQPCAIAAAEEVEEGGRIDACLAEHSPDAGLYLARRSSMCLGVPWVADFRDPALQPLGRLASAIYEPWLRRLLRSAAVTINVNPYWASLDRSYFGRPAECVPNGFDPSEFPAAPPRRHSGRLHVVYLGSILHPYQRMEIFLDGLRALKESDPDRRSPVLFTYIGGADREVRQLADDRSVGDFVRTMGRIERPAALAVAGEADVLLVLGAVAERADLWYSRGYVPGKLLEYLGLRKPILCVPSDRGFVDELLRETRAGTTRDTPSEVAAFLAVCARTLQTGHPLDFRPDAKALARYSRWNQAGRVAEILDRCVAEDRGAESN
jgi:hypothetical protein